MNRQDFASELLVEPFEDLQPPRFGKSGPIVDAEIFLRTVDIGPRYGAAQEMEVRQFSVSEFDCYFWAGNVEDTFDVRLSARSEYSLMRNRYQGSLENMFRVADLSESAYVVVSGAVSRVVEELRSEDAISFVSRRLTIPFEVVRDCVFYVTGGFESRWLIEGRPERSLLLPVVPEKISPLEEIYALSQADRIHEALDRVFDMFDSLMSSADFHECDNLLAAADVRRLNSAVALGFLTATWAARDQMRLRKTFYEGLREHLLLDKTPETVKQLLAGLE